MATYYINPTGNNTDRTVLADAPTNFTELIAFGALANSDIIYIEGDNGTITQTTGTLVLKGTFQKNPTSTNRPLINFTHAFQFFCTCNTVSMDLTIKELDFSCNGANKLLTYGTTDVLGNFLFDSVKWKGGQGFVGGTNGGTISSYVIQNCVLIDMSDNAIRIPAANVSGLKVINNSLYNVAQTNAYYAVSITSGTNIEYRNNIISNSDQGRNLTGSTGTVDNNIVYAADSNPFIGIPQQPNEITSNPLYTDPGSDDLTLQSGSPAIDDGATTTATVDYLGVSRPQGSAFDMGAFEFEQTPPTCWTYTAKYKGSSRLYRDNGPGLFPKTLKVPGNVDISTGTMIDEGIKIDPSKYTVN